MKSRVVIVSLSLALGVSSVLPALAGVEARVRTKIDGVKMKVLGKDLSETVQTVRVNEDATLKGMAVGEKNWSWISLTHGGGAFFDQRGRKCTVTLFSEIDEQLSQLEGQENPFKFMKADDVEPRENPEEYEVKITGDSGGTDMVANIEGTVGTVDMKVTKKETGETVSDIHMTRTYTTSDTPYALVERFDLAFAERNIRNWGEALGFGKDFGKMKGQIYGQPEVEKAMSEFDNAGMREGTTLKSVTRIKSEGQERDKSKQSDDAGSKIGKVFAKFRRKPNENEQDEGSPEKQEVKATQGSEKIVTLTQELLGLNEAKVSLPEECEKALAKKMSK